MTRLSPLQRASFALRGARSEDERDIARDLRRHLKRARRREGERQPVQVAGEPLEAPDYARWRGRALRRGSVSSAPQLQPGRYALVLFAFAPRSTEQFIRHGAAPPLMPPTVGAFLPTTEPATALAGTLAAWLELYSGPVALAPPLLHVGGRWRVADLGIDWDLPPSARAPN